MIEEQNWPTNSCKQKERFAINKMNLLQKVCNNTQTKRREYLATLRRICDSDYKNKGTNNSENKTRNSMNNRTNWPSSY